FAAPKGQGESSPGQRSEATAALGYSRFCNIPPPVLHGRGDKRGVGSIAIHVMHLNRVSAAQRPPTTLNHTRLWATDADGVESEILVQENSKELRLSTVRSNEEEPNLQ